jgi:hypothetical protein
MEDLNLPVFKEKVRKKRWLSMDEYLKFVTDNLKYAGNNGGARKQKKDVFVGKRFILR